MGYSLAPASSGGARPGVFMQKHLSLIGRTITSLVLFFPLGSQPAQSDRRRRLRKNPL
jgi:hypothetical protein